VAAKKPTDDMPDFLTLMFKLIATRMEDGIKKTMREIENDLKHITPDFKRLYKYDIDPK